MSCLQSLVHENCDSILVACAANRLGRCIADARVGEYGGIFVALMPGQIATMLVNDSEVAMIAWRGPRIMGLDGQFVGVALGLLAYGILNASAIRPNVWSNKEPQ
jgi:hypothetical protein